MTKGFVMTSGILVNHKPLDDIVSIGRFLLYNVGPQAYWHTERISVWSAFEDVVAGRNGFSGTLNQSEALEKVGLAFPKQKIHTSLYKHEDH